VKSLLENSHLEDYEGDEGIILKQVFGRQTTIPF
jgi:hypothetical protein